MTPRLYLPPLLLLFCVSGMADDEGSRVVDHVRIRIEQKSCDARTRVSLVSSAGPTVSESYADNQCVAEFFNVPAGNYRAVVAGPGIYGTRELVIDGSRQQELDLPVSATGESKDGAARLPTVAAGDFTIPRKAKKELERAEQSLSRDDLPKALEALRKAIEIDPDYADAYSELGVVYRRMGEPGESRDALEKAIRLNGHLAPAYVNLALLEMSENRFSTAEELLDKASAIGLNDPPTLILLASVELMTQHYDKALVNCRKAHATPQVRHATAHYIAARAYERKNRPDDALAELQILLSEEQTGPRADAARKEMAALQAGK